jgi:hypothetical protein
MKSEDPLTPINSIEELRNVRKEQLEEIKLSIEKAKKSANPYLKVLKEHKLIKKYYDEVFSPMAALRGYDSRDHLVQYYSWAIPNRAALNALSKISPIIEIGAGLGYWAYLLNKRKIKIKCFDNFSWPIKGSKWFPIEKGTYTALTKSKAKTLFLCWPPYKNSVAYKCLKTFKGDFVAYIGEGHGGCTGDDGFHEELEKSWKTMKVVHIPQWSGIHDRLEIYKRRIIK